MTMSIKLITKLKGALSINESMARNGILFLSFGLLLLAVKQVGETPAWSLIPGLGLIHPPPVCFSTPLRIILIVISLMVMFAVFWISRKYKLASFLKGRLKLVAKLIVVFLLLLFLFFALWLTPAIPVKGYTILGIFTLGISLLFMIAVFCRWLACKLDDCLKSQFRPVYWIIFLLVYIFGFLRGLSSIPVENIAYRYANWLGLIWFVVIVIIMYKAAWQVEKRK